MKEFWIHFITLISYSVTATINSKSIYFWPHPTVLISTILDPKIWHGDPSIATYSIIGNFKPEKGSINAMFDNLSGENSMYHSFFCTGDRGVVINFVSPVQYQDVMLHTGCDPNQFSCRQRYKNVCLYADGVKVSCTPAGLEEAPPVIHFKNYTYEASPVITSEYRIMFEDEGLNMCAQIEELYVQYIDITGNTR